MSRILRFAFVGGLGFVADAGMLMLLLAGSPLGPFSARLVSVSFAMTVTWLCNRTLTFAPSGRGVVQEGARYGSVAVGIACFNYLLYSGLLLAIPALPPLAALVIAAAAAMALSYLGYSRLVFDR
ncbi:GtrA family protein [Mesorhizobium marinum]|uniref:GtrA family protein n=1 Tax=Mesorhizobium marinum TaxID=3228790 RepID=UPI003465308D